MSLHTQAEVLHDALKISGLTAKSASNLTQDNVNNIFELLAQKKLNEKHIAALIQVAPQFVTLAQSSLNTQVEAIKSAGASQRDAIAAVHSGIKAIETMACALKSIAEGAESKNTKDQISLHILEISRLITELAKIIQKMNSENNFTWVKMTGVAAGVLTIACIGASIFLGGKNSGEVDIDRS